MRPMALAAAALLFFAVSEASAADAPSGKFADLEQCAALLEQKPSEALRLFGRHVQNMSREEILSIAKLIRALQKPDYYHTQILQRALDRLIIIEGAALPHPAQPPVRPQIEFEMLPGGLPQSLQEVFREAIRVFGSRDLRVDADVILGFPFDPRRRWKQCSEDALFQALANLVIDPTHAPLEPWLGRLEGQDCLGHRRPPALRAIFYLLLKQDRIAEATRLFPMLLGHQAGRCTEDFLGDPGFLERFLGEWRRPLIGLVAETLDLPQPRTGASYLMRLVAKEGGVDDAENLLALFQVCVDRKAQHLVEDLGVALANCVESTPALGRANSRSSRSFGRNWSEAHEFSCRTPLPKELQARIREALRTWLLHPREVSSQAAVANVLVRRKVEGIVELLRDIHASNGAEAVRQITHKALAEFGEPAASPPPANRTIELVLQSGGKPLAGVRIRWQVDSRPFGLGNLMAAGATGAIRLASDSFLEPDVRKKNLYVRSAPLTPADPMFEVSLTGISPADPPRTVEVPLGQVRLKLSHERGLSAISRKRIYLKAGQDWEFKNVTVPHDGILSLPQVQPGRHELTIATNGAAVTKIPLAVGPGLNSHEAFILHGSNVNFTVIARNGWPALQGVTTIIIKDGRWGDEDFGPLGHCPDQAAGLGVGNYRFLIGLRALTSEDVTKLRKNPCTYTPSGYAVREVEITVSSPEDIVLGSIRPPAE